MAAPYRGVLFDLFGTLVLVDPDRLPVLTVDGSTQRTTVAGLVPVLAEFVPDVPPPAFLTALREVSREMARARADDHVELPSRERFRRALVRVGCATPLLTEAAAHCSRAHMALIAAATYFPAAHTALLARLRARFRLGVVSNFDDTATAYDILLRHGIAPAVDTVVISEAVGLRKPHPAPVRTGLRSLDLAPGEALFVGDTLEEDIAAARAAGVDGVWIDATGRGLPSGAPAPRWVVRALPEVADLLG